MGLTELLIQKDGKAASVSKIIETIKERSEQPSEVDATADVQQQDDNMSGEVMNESKLIKDIINKHKAQQ